MNGEGGILVRKPAWLKVKLPGGANFVKVKKLVNDTKLHTVCESAHCPNIGECWSRRTATFMILGDRCTRNCRFCAVKNGSVEPPDPNEPERVAQAVQKLALNYAVITSVTRDDLADGGAAYFAETIRRIRERCPQCKVEVLIPDFLGSNQSLQTVLDEHPDVLNHNIETVPRLYPQARPQADYRRSLQLLERAFHMGARSKSGLMVGLGESFHEIIEVMYNLLDHHCTMLTIGQYLQPSKKHMPVQCYLAPKEFGELKRKGLEMGFDHIESGPLVRSSYHADLQFNSIE
ncbi:lipoyl synthase [candidate division KSB1 bacterium]|nr:lipoyl synthase [candidate division KSB1 bacterium]RQW05604.1 MAG: lipoyl synthase [candidate division KSB1 bacterium]